MFDCPLQLPNFRNVETALAEKTLSDYAAQGQSFLAGGGPTALRRQSYLARFF